MERVSFIDEQTVTARAPPHPRPPAHFLPALCLCRKETGKSFSNERQTNVCLWSSGKDKSVHTAFDTFPVKHLRTLFLGGQEEEDGDG